MAGLKISNNSFLGRIELQRFKEYLDDLGFRKFLLDNSIKFGLVNNSIDGNFENGRVEKDSTDNTIKHKVLSAIDNQARFIEKPAANGIAVPTDSNWYWVKTKYAISNFEQGTISISADGQLTGSGTEFLKILRGVATDFPTKISFPESVGNTGEYDILDVTSDTSATLNGVQFTSESNLKFTVVGTFAPSAVPTASEKNIFQYNSCTLTLEQETVTDTPPSFVEGEDFFLARVQSVGTDVIVQDKRDLNIYQTVSDFNLTDIDSEANPLIGVEAVKYKQSNSARDRNIVELAWGFRSSNWTTDSSLNRITLISGQGGKFKATSDFNTGNFDGWRVYFEDGTYAIIKQSTLQASQVNLILDSLNPSKLSNTSQELLIVPNVEEIKIMATAVNDTQLKEQSYNFPINTPLAKIELDVYENGAEYELSYQNKVFNNYSSKRIIPVDSVGYFNESSFDANGNLNTQEIDRNRVPVSSDGVITLDLATTAFINQIQAVTTGDLFGVNRRELSNSNPIIGIEVGDNKKVQIIEGTLSLNVDNFINIRTTGATEGNTFEFIYEADFTLGGNRLAITQNYVNTGDVGTVLFEFNDFYVKQSLDNNLRVKLVFDGTNWIVNDIVSSRLEVESRVFEIGDWDMNTNDLKVVTTDLTVAELNKVTEINVVIYNDSETVVTNLINPSILGGFTTIQGSIELSQDASQIVTLRRVANGFYDSTAYDDISINRGYVTVKLLY